MAFTVPNQSESIEDPTGVYPQAQLDSVDLQILAAGVGGVNGVSAGCAVTAQGSPNNTVAVASGSVVVAGVQASVTSGNVTMTAAHASLARFDLITVNNAGTKAYTAGTAAATPVFPAIPANSVVLAAIYVDANDNVINSNQIIDKRVTVPIPTSATAGWVTVEKSADTVRNNTTTLTADPDLLFAMVANGEYRLRWSVYYSAQTASDIKFRHVGPASPTRLMLFSTSYNTSTGAPINARIDTAYSAADIFVTNNLEGPWEGNGYIHNGANAGNFELHWAQNTAVAENTTARAGSWLEYNRVD